MKKILYFTIGFLISFSYLNYCYAYEDQAPWTVQPDFEIFPASGSLDYTDLPECSLPAGGHHFFECGVTTSDITSAFGGSGGTLCGTYSRNGISFYVYAIAIGTGTYRVHYFWIPTSTSCQDNIPGDFPLWQDDYPVPDNDGDGIPDEFDLYPTDSTNYQWSIISQVKNSSGEAVHMMIKTDRGDIFEFGERPVDMTGYEDVLFIAPVLRDPEYLETLPMFGGGGSEYSTVDNSEYYESLEDYATQENEIGSGTDFNNDSVASTGSETDTESLQQIVTNTDSISNNISRLGDYLQSINQSLGQINNKQDIQMNTADTSSNEKDELSQSEIDSLTSSAGNTDSEYSTAQNIISGDATLVDDAPTEYQNKISISDRMTNYLTNNPIMAIIENSGVTINNSTDHVSWDYNGNTINMSVGNFDTELQAFGQILVAMATLAGMLLIFRGF